MGSGSRWGAGPSCIPQVRAAALVINSATPRHGAPATAAADPHHHLPHRGLRRGGADARRGSRDRLRPPERDGGGVPGPPAHAAVRRSGRGRARDAGATRPAGRSTRWCRSTTSPPWWPPRSARRSACASTRSPRPQATRNKLVMRGAARARGGPLAALHHGPVDEDPRAAAGRMTYPCVLKPLVLSASRGVIRADDAAQFVAAFERIRAILRAAGRRRSSARGRHDPGRGLRAREARSRSRGCWRRRAPHPGSLRQARSARRSVLRGDHLRDAVAPARGHPGPGGGDDGGRGARARPLGRRRCTRELRLRPGRGRPRPVVLEIAARSIGGLCGRTLRFGDRHVARGADPAPRPRAGGALVRARAPGRRGHDDPDPARRRAGGGRRASTRRARCRTSRT